MTTPRHVEIGTQEHEFQAVKVPRDRAGTVERRLESHAIGYVALSQAP